MIQTTIEWVTDTSLPKDDGDYYCYLRGGEFHYIGQFSEGSWLNGPPDAWGKIESPRWSVEDFNGAYTKPLFSEESLFRKKLLPDNQVYLNRLKGHLQKLIDDRKSPQGWGWVMSGNGSVPVYIVKEDLPKIPVYVKSKTSSLNINKEMMKGVPIPRDFKGAEGPDGHAFIADEYNNIGYEFYRVKKDDEGHWGCSWGGIINNLSGSSGRFDVVKSEKQGARACGLALAGGLIMYEELKKGVIPHAICCAVPYTDKDWVFPASRTDNNSTSANRDGFPYGLQLRFPHDMTINPNATPLAKMINTAIRDYGLWVTDQTHGQMLFFLEDRTRFPEGSSVYREFTNGETWRVISQIPWKELILA